MTQLAILKDWRHLTVKRLPQAHKQQMQRQKQQQEAAEQHREVSIAKGNGQNDNVTPVHLANSTWSSCFLPACTNQNSSDSSGCSAVDWTVVHVLCEVHRATTISCAMALWTVLHLCEGGVRIHCMLCNLCLSLCVANHFWASSAWDAWDVGCICPIVLLILFILK
eukprot:CAMPEP_0172902142 /NCGR_PEP_ID=MMETSP1075-20121228/167790_1 /TAXON_ID=2916 /ORGANISM="Ceratium fusus, Strain PA161109" /LENGTH=165 /DNA_ID=CAMNT_0013758675 /DNA_START=153 /DNA_END=650 /DNA_ORIENTATION=+